MPTVIPGTATLEKDVLVDHLELMLGQACVYHDDTRQPKRPRNRTCDCRYGGNDLRGGEQGNGCPELMTVIFLLEQIKGYEYRRIMRRRKEKTGVMEAIRQTARPLTYSDTSLAQEVDQTTDALWKALESLKDFSRRGTRVGIRNPPDMLLVIDGVHHESEDEPYADTINYVRMDKLSDELREKIGEELVKANA